MKVLTGYLPYVLLIAIVSYSSGCAKLKCNQVVANGGTYTSTNSGYIDIECQKNVNLNIISSNISTFIPFSGCTAGFTYQLKEQVNINRQTSLLTYSDTLFITNPASAFALISFFVFIDTTRAYKSLLFYDSVTISKLPYNGTSYFLVIPNTGNYPINTSNIWANLISVNAQNSGGCSSLFETYIAGTCTVDTGSTFNKSESFSFIGIIDASGNLQFLLQSDQNYKVITGNVSSSGAIANGKVSDIHASFLSSLKASSSVVSVGTNFSAHIDNTDTIPWTKMTFSN